MSTSTRSTEWQLHAAIFGEAQADAWAAMPTHKPQKPRHAVKAAAAKVATDERHIAVQAILAKRPGMTRDALIAAIGGDPETASRRIAAMLVNKTLLQSRGELFFI